MSVDYDAEKNKLLALRATQSRAARLRPLLPVINELLKEGVKAQPIVAELETIGIKISVSGLHQDLVRWRKSKNGSRQVASPLQKNPPPKPHIEKVGTSPSIPETPDTTTGQISNKGELRRLRDTSIDLNYYAQLGKKAKE